MVSIIPFDCSKLNTRMSLDICKVILTHADICSYIIIKKYDRIEIYDFHSYELINTINIEPLTNLHNMSVSKCYKYIIGSDESHLCIWNIEDFSLIQTIDIKFKPIFDTDEHINSNTNGEAVHTFTINNKLLVANYNKIKQYSNTSGIWIKETNYKINYEHHIVCITTNISNENMFACGTIYGDVFIFNNSTMVYSFTTCLPLMRSDHLPEITSIAFNKNILVVSSIGKNNLLLNMDTMSITKIEEPILDYPFCYFTIDNYLITPCMKYFIGTFNSKSYMWDTLTGKIIKELPIILETISYTPEYTKIVSYGEKYNIRVVDYNRYLNN